MTTKVQSRRVLVVEDDPKWARDMFQWLLEDQCACQVEVASDYKTALGKLHAKPPFDLLVVDVSLSETDPDNIDGLRLLEQANREDLHIPAIIVSGRGAWKISEPELKKLGVQRYMRKEKFETNEFSTAVCAVLGSPPAEIQPIPRGPTLSGAPDRDALAKAKITGSVLIVDDEDGWREEILAFCLREDGYDVQTAKTYDEAIRRIDAYKFDVAIVDLNLSESEPVARGWILLRKIREQGADTQVIVISGQPVTGDDLERALRYHVFDFIKKGKGFDFDVLLSKVQRAIRSRAAGDQAQHVGNISRADSRAKQAPSTPEFRQTIEALVHQDCLEEALQKLRDYHTDANVLLSQLNRTKRQVRQGTITQEQAETKYNNIAKAVLELVSA